MLVERFQVFPSSVFRDSFFWNVPKVTKWCPEMSEMVDTKNKVPVSGGLRAGRSVVVAVESGGTGTDNQG